MIFTINRMINISCVNTEKLKGLLGKFILIIHNDLNWMLIIQLIRMSVIA